MQPSPQDPIARATCSLEGLSVGDAFGETFFVNPDQVEGLIAERALAARTWTYTDDTLMALSIFSVLRQHGYIHQPELARSFAERYDHTRGYGPAMHRLLWDIKCGEDWSESAQSLFEGQGSFGNGAAMRVAYPSVQVVAAWELPLEVGDSDEIRAAHEDYILNQLKIQDVTHFYCEELITIDQKL